MDWLIALATFVLLLVIQAFLALVAYLNLYRLRQRYSYDLLDKSTIADLLQRYMQIFETGVNIALRSSLLQPAKVVKDTLFVNKRLLHTGNLFDMVFISYQLQLLQAHNSYLRHYRSWQVAGLVTSLVMATLAITVNQLWILPAILIQLVLLASGIIYFWLIGEVLIDARDNLYILLDLTAIEREKCLSLSKKLQAESFCYVFTLPISFVKFFIPRRYS